MYENVIDNFGNFILTDGRELGLRCKNWSKL